MPNMGRDRRIDRSFFIRVAVHSLRRLRTIRNPSGFSKKRLRRISEKISDLKDSSITGAALTELEYELSRDITGFRGSHDVIEGRYISYFDNIARWYREQQKQPPEVEKEMLSKIYGETFEFRERMEPYGNYRLWHVVNRESGNDSMLYIYNSGDLEGKDSADVFSNWMELDHSSILKLRGVHTKSGSFAIETEYFDSDFLWSQIKSIDRKKAFRMLSKVAGAIEYANSHDVYHTALSPGTVMVSPDGEVKVSGWNSSFLMRYESNTEKKRLMRFIAPEISEGCTDKPTEKADVFTLSRLASFVLSNGTSIYVDNEKVRIPYQLANALSNGVSRDPMVRGTVPGILEELDNAIRDFGDMGSAESGIQHVDTDSDKGEVISVTGVDENVNTAVKHNQAGESNNPLKGAKRRNLDIASQLEDLVDRGRYSSILAVLESNSDYIIKTEPSVSDMLREIIPNLKVVIRMPGSPKKDLNERILEVASLLGKNNI